VELSDDQLLVPSALPPERPVLHQLMLPEEVVGVVWEREWHVTILPNFIVNSLECIVCKFGKIGFVGCGKGIGKWSCINLDASSPVSV